MARKKLQKNQSDPPLALKLITLGILLFLLGTISNVQVWINSLILGYKEAPKHHVYVQSPKSLSIPSVKIDVKIEEGGIVNGNWVLSDTSALYLPTSGKIGEGFNTIIYAHNTNNLFANLKDIKKDDVIFIKDNKDREFRYRVFFKEDVDPTDIRKLYSEEKNIITLFTCDGWYDQQRLLIKAKLIDGMGVNKYQTRRM